MVTAQDIHFSQFYMSPLVMNPAMAGAQNDMRAALNYKSQWQSVTNAYKTFGCSFDMRLTKTSNTKGHLAAGANFFSDKAGDGGLKTTLGGLALAYHARLSPKSTLGGSVLGGFGQRSVTYSALQWGSQYDGTAFNPGILPGENTSTPALSYFDLGAGAVWHFDNSGSRSVTNNHDEKVTLGVAVFHLNRPNHSFYGAADERLYMKTVVHGNALFSLPNSNVAFVPGFMYARQGKAQEIYAGTLIRYLIGQDSKYTGFKQGAAFSLGGFLRAKDAISVAMLLEYANYSIGFSYDVNTSSLRTASNARGGFEVALKFVTPNPFGVKSSARSSFN
ncbi:MAG: hypothetical protein FD123_281 [Bacteroidetes bacterium]|nr:MAG: hypothetical protein FD123_281 [Bacteroidota bacterium]